MDHFERTTLEHANWRESDGRLLFPDQLTKAGPVSYLPFLDRAGRVGYEVEAQGTTECLLLEPSPNRKAQKVMVVYTEDSEEEVIGLVDIDLGWTFRKGHEMPFEMNLPRLVGGAAEIASTYWLQVAADLEPEERINFEGMGISSVGEHRYVPFLDAVGKVGYQVLGPDRESAFLYLRPADAGEEKTISLNAGERMTWSDKLLAAYEMANWLEGGDA